MSSVSFTSTAVPLENILEPAPPGLPPFSRSNARPSAITLGSTLPRCYAPPATSPATRLPPIVRWPLDP